MKREIIPCEVLVAGGGSAGLAAAVSAARKSASVILLERNSFLGGKATATYVGTICGLYYTSHDPVSRYVSDGFAYEFAEKLRKRSGTSPIRNKMGLHFLPYQPFDFRILCDEYISEEKINIFYHSVVSSVEHKNGKITSVEAISYDRKITIQPRAVIDCTGEGLLSTLADIPVIENEEYQASAQVFSMEGVEASSEINLGMIVMKEVQKAIAENQIPESYVNVSIVPGSLKEKQVYLKIGIDERIGNNTNKISTVEMTARKMVMAISSLLKEKTEAFRNAHVSDVAPEAGVRTGRRSKGKYILTKEDVMHCKKDTDSAGRGSWPIEFWDLGKRVKMDFFKMDDYYDIPKDCLRSGEISNLFFAGRNISATEEAIASARVIGTCLQTGYAAGQLSML